MTPISSLLCNKEPSYKTTSAFLKDPFLQLLQRKNTSFFLLFTFMLENFTHITFCVLVINVIGDWVGKKIAMLCLKQHRLSVSGFSQLSMPVYIL